MNTDRRRSFGILWSREDAYLSYGARSLSLVQLNGGSSTDALRLELERAITGEVRFDTISRALYSTDASVYQIQPVGVVIPKTRQDVERILEICRKHRCPITMRG